MKKTLIASAVAAAALTSNAFAMDNASDLAAQLDAMPTVYGNIQLATDYTTEEKKNMKEETGQNTFDNGSTIGFKHEHEISAGLTGFLKAEFDFDAAKGEDQFDVDEAFIGVKGDFGSVLVGSEDTVAEWADPIDMYEAYGLGADYDMKESDQVQYVGTFDALTVGVSYSIDNDADARAAVGAKYEMGDIALQANYTMGRATDTDVNGTTVYLDRGDSYGVSGTYTMGDISISAQYNARGEQAIATVDQDNAETFIGLLGQYAMGANNFALGYGLRNTDAAASTDEMTTSSIYAQALHNVSDNMYVYVEYVMENESSDDDATDTDSSALALGATYYF